MGRPMTTRRTWVKIYVDKWLRGTLREETAELRGIWMDLLVLAGDSAYGDIGMIQFSDKQGFTDEQLADLFGISLLKWGAIKDRLIETKRIKCRTHNRLEILNWSRYQSEYQRKQFDSETKSDKKSVSKSDKKSNTNLGQHTEAEADRDNKDRDIKDNKEQEQQTPKELISDLFSFLKTFDKDKRLTKKGFLQLLRKHKTCYEDNWLEESYRFLRYKVNGGKIKNPIGLFNTWITGKVSMRNDFDWDKFYKKVLKPKYTQRSQDSGSEKISDILKHLKYF